MTALTPSSDQPPMHRGTHRSAAARRSALPALLLGLVIGCSPAVDNGGCGPAPRSTDASSPYVQLVSEQAPCTGGPEAVRGSDPHLIVSFTCPGESDPFLVAIKVDGVLLTMKEARGAGYGTTVTMDFGTWEPADTIWHTVEVVLDPLNLFHEADESNNVGSARFRIVPPDAAIGAAVSGFVVPLEAGGDGYTLVTQVRQGTPVDVLLAMQYGGPYERIVRSIRSGTVLSATDSISMSGCPAYVSSVFSTRWTPPGPGTYEVEFRIEPRGNTPDDPTNNVVTKTLTVLGSANTRTEGVR
jgi:hypothetical protein